MQTVEDIRTAVPSKLADLRDVPLAEMPTLSRATLDETLGRVVRGPEQVAPVPVAAFQSAI
jgi:FXSXX-COOH protein